MTCKWFLHVHRRHFRFLFIGIVTYRANLIISISRGFFKHIILFFIQDKFAT